ncbi:MAG: glycosyltransferase, partial [Pyrinomonadaceae bacterium]
MQESLETYPNVHWTFFCVSGKPGRMDDLARKLGADVIHSRYEIGDKIRFLRALRDVMQRGHYDVLHCHHDIMSAAYLAASAGLPFRKRIVHVHNTSLSLPTPNRIKAELVREPMRQMCLRMADQIVGISTDALNSLLGSRQRNPTRHLVVHYAVDTERFSSAPVDRQGFRAGLGLNSGTKLLLFIGRLTDYKNPRFVVEILEHLVEEDQQVAAVFAGYGVEAESIMEFAKQKSLEDRVRLLGFRDDVPDLMANSDILIWPSLEDPKEGLGLGILEAQAAALPVIMSRSVPADAILVTELIDVLPLSDGPGMWAARISEILSRPPLERKRVHELVKASSFSLSAGISSLMGLYQ